MNPGVDRAAEPAERRLGFPEDDEIPLRFPGLSAEHSIRRPVAEDQFSKLEA